MGFNIGGIQTDNRCFDHRGLDRWSELVCADSAHLHFTTVAMTTLECFLSFFSPLYLQVEINKASSMDMLTVCGSAKVVS